MYIKNIFLFVIFHHSILNLSAEKTWTYDFTSIEFTTSDEDFISGNLEVVRVSRGVFGIDGYLEFKQALDDSYMVDVIFYRDKFCKGNYDILPYSLRNCKMTTAMNEMYKKIAMQNLKECATNAPYFDVFVAPFTERYVVFEKCKISEDNLPSYMNEGCYIIEIKISGPNEAKVLAHTVVETKKYLG